MGSTTDKWKGWLMWVCKQSSVDEALSNNASNTSCKRQEANGFSICKYLRMQACSRDLEMTAHFSFATSQVRYEDNRVITGLYATRQTPNITLEESKTGNCLLFCLQLWKSLWADQDQKLRCSRGFLWNIYQITCHHSVQMKPLLETPSVDIAFLSLECLLFGPSVCIFFFSVSIRHTFFWCNPR